MAILNLVSLLSQLRLDTVVDAVVVDLVDAAVHSS